MKDFILKAEKLSKHYDSPQGVIKALDNLSINIPDGSIALLGPNGSGKSTLIKLILGLILPTSGNFSLFGVDRTNFHSLRNRFGYMPETPSIITKVNAVKFVRHFGQLSGLSFTRAMQRTHEVLDYVGLGEERYRKLESYSTGMKQRLLFAQALVHDPDVIILDEPTTGLSPEGREDMLKLISEINKDYGKSIIFSTHILPDIENICTYTIILNKGSMIFEGDIAKIEEMYAETIQLQLSSNHKKICQILEDMEYVVNDIGKTIIIEAKKNKLPSFNELMDIVNSQNSSLLSIQKHKPNLEDLFLNLIKKDIDRE